MLSDELIPGIVPRRSLGEVELLVAGCWLLEILLRLIYVRTGWRSSTDQKVHFDC
jgi:hypothetical protein